MGLLEWLSGLGREEPLYEKDRRCTNCLHCWYSDMDREYKCSNFFAPSDYQYKCKKSPNALTDCPKFDMKH